MKLSKELTTVTPFSKLIAMLLFILLPFLGFYLGMQYGKSKNDTNNTQASAAIEKSNNKDDLCTSYVNVGKIAESNNNIFITQCKDWIGELGLSAGPDTFMGTKIETIDTFKDLFVFPGLEHTGYLPREVVVFPAQKPEFILIKAMYYSGGSYLESFGIYMENNGKLTRVFKHSFKESVGRGVRVKPSDTNTEFEITSQIRNNDTGKWTEKTEKYQWDDNKKSFNLINTVSKDL